MGVLDNDVDGLAGWVARRTRLQHAVVTSWTVAVIATSVLVLLSDAFLAMPLVPLVIAGGWLAWEWASDRWWGARSLRAGHPVVRADLAWSTASGGTLPDGWHETSIPGSLHRTSSAWVWRPSCWVNGRLRTLLWSVDEITGYTMRDVPSAGAPPCAQLSLYLRNGHSIDLLVRRPSRLRLAPLGPDQLR